MILEQLGISKLDLKRQNRMQVLKILKQRGPTSRIDIANTLELTRAAVTIITNEMIEQGILIEVGEYRQSIERIQRGRKKILLDINHNYRFVIGVIVEKSILQVGLSTLNGLVLDKITQDIYDLSSFEEMSTFIRNSIKDILKNNCLTSDNLLGIGVGIHPIMYSKMKISVINKVADYSKLFEEFAQYTQLPVVVDNEIKGAAMANIDFQKIKNANRHNIAFLQYGETYHFVVTNLNDPIKSYDNRTDFVDNIIVRPDAPHSDNSVRNGCVKLELTPSALIGKIKQHYGPESTPHLYDLSTGEISKVTRTMIFEAVSNGDEVLKSMYIQTIKLISVLINNLVFSTNPQKLVLHDFNFSDKEYAFFKSILEGIAGKDISSIIDLSIVENKNRFLAGCAIAIRELFFAKGGFDLHI